MARPNVWHFFVKRVRTRTSTALKMRGGPLGLWAGLLRKDLATSASQPLCSCVGECAHDRSMASDGFTEWMITTNYGPLGIRSEPSPEESPRSALSDRSWAHITHVDEPRPERDLAERQAAAAGTRMVARMASEQDNQERARNGLLYTMERFRRLVTPAQVEEEEEEEEEVEEVEEEEEEQEEPNQRELDLWLLESQVPGCTRERAERAYAQSREDVARALPLARMATLLGDRVAMVEFLMEQIPGSYRSEASFAYDEERENIVEAVIALHRRTQRRLNQSVLNSRAKQRLRIRTVFMLALLYREWYGQLERAAEDVLAQVPLQGRSRNGTLASFITPDGSRWTHTREEGWERRAPLTPASLGRAVRATEQLADVAEARGQAQMAHRARQTAADLQAQLTNDSDEAPPSPQSPLPPPVLQRSDERARLIHTPDGTMGFTTVVVQTPYDERHLVTRARGPLSTRDYGPEDLERWHDWDPSIDGSDADDDGNSNQPPTVAAESSSSAEEDDENEIPTAGAYARPRPFVRSVVRVHPLEAYACTAKRNLRILQEQLDTEMANAAQGIVMSEGAYVAMMNAIKALWEQVDPHPTEVN